jgi:hypothetical protein
MLLTISVLFLVLISLSSISFANGHGPQEVSGSTRPTKEAVNNESRPANDNDIDNRHSPKQGTFVLGYGHPLQLFEFALIDLKNFLTDLGVKLNINDSSDALKNLSVQEIMVKLNKDNGTRLLYVRLNIEKWTQDSLEVTCYNIENKASLWSEQTTSFFAISAKRALNSMLSKMKEKLRARMGCECLKQEVGDSAANDKIKLTR